MHIHAEPLDTRWQQGGRRDDAPLRADAPRREEGGEAIALLYVDHTLPKDVLAELSATGVFDQIKPLAFEVG